MNMVGVSLNLITTFINMVDVLKILIKIGLNITFINMVDVNKDDVIKNIYFDRSGFGSVAITYKDAKKKEPSITLNDVKDFFKKNVEVKRKQRGINSFIPPHNNFTYQIDLFFMGKNDFENKQKFRAGLVLIDVLSKFAVVVPIKSKDGPDVIAGTREALNKMKEKPQLIYTDDERAIAGDEFKEFVEGEGIELYRTRNHPAFAERFIRTFKDKLFKRVEADEKKGKENLQWIDYIFEIMFTYNNKDIHSATNMTPNEARKKDNEFRARVNIASKARKKIIP